MGGLYSRIKTWVTTEDVTYSDLNAEFDNVLTNFVPLMIDDYSANASQMQVQTDPGEVGSESLATTTAGEIARIRKILAEITGNTYWYSSPSTSLSGLANAIGTGITANRLISGRLASTSSQPKFLIPHGAARTATVAGASTNFKYSIAGTEYTIASNVTVTNLTLAPSSNNTCTVNDANLSGQYWTKYLGEDGSEIPIDAVGSGISALAGQLAAFKVGATEYFIAEVGTNKLIKARRGYFFDSSDATIPRLSLSDNAVITLQKLTWVFAKTDGTLTVTYSNPVWSFDEPQSPSTNDYWFDYSANKWKYYNVTQFVDATAILIGICCQDTANTVAARSFEFFAPYDPLNTVELDYSTAAIARAKNIGSVINVWGVNYRNEYNGFVWDMTLDRASGVSETSSTYYYFYVTQAGDKLISDKKPHDRREDLFGYYHPSESWRCVGYALNDSGSDLSEVISYYRKYPAVTIRSVTATDSVLSNDATLILSGASFTLTLPSAAAYPGRELEIIHNGTSTTNIYTLATLLSQTIGGIASASVKLYLKNEHLKLKSDNANWVIVLRENFAIHARAHGTPTGGSGSDVAFIWGTEDVDTHAAYDNTTGQFTVPADGAGLYLCCVNINSSNGSGIYAYIGGVKTYLMGYISSNGSVSGIFRFAAADVVTFAPADGSMAAFGPSCSVSILRMSP